MSENEDPNRIDWGAYERDTRAEAQTAWRAYRSVYLLGRPKKDRRRLRRREFIAGYLAANDLTP